MISTGYFLKENRFEAVIMLLIAIEGIGQLIFRTDLVTLMFNLFGLGEFTFISNLFVQLYFLLMSDLKPEGQVNGLAVKY